MSTSRTDLLIIRHGETEWNALQRLQGWSDIHLNEAGLNQAQHLKEYLESHYLKTIHDKYGLNPTQIYTSDLQRAIQTAQPLATALELEIKTDQRLRERDYGQLEGKNWREAFDAVDTTTHITPIDFAEELAVEPLKDFAERTQQALNTLIERHPNELIVIVSHGGALDMMWRLFLGLAVNTKREVLQRNTTINHVRYENKAWELLDWGHQAHLQSM